MDEHTFGRVLGGALIFLFWATVPILILKAIQKITPKHEWMFRTPISKVIASLVTRRREARREAKMLEAAGLQKLD